MGHNGGGGVPMHSKARLVLTYVGIWECLDYVPLVRYVSSTFLLLTQIQHPMMVDTNKNPVSEWMAQQGKCIEACLELQLHFTTFVLSVGRMVREETKVATKQLAAALLTKWYRWYLSTCGYAQAYISLNLLHTFSFLLCVHTRQSICMPSGVVEASRLDTRVF